MYMHACMLAVQMLPSEFTFRLPSVTVTTAKLPFGWSPGVKQKPSNNLYLLNVGLAPSPTSACCCGSSNRGQQAQQQTSPNSAEQRIARATTYL